MSIIFLQMWSSGLSRRLLQGLQGCSDQDTTERQNMESRKPLQRYVHIITTKHLQMHALFVQPWFHALSCFAHWWLRLAGLPLWVLMTYTATVWVHGLRVMEWVSVISLSPRVSVIWPKIWRAYVIAQLWAQYDFLLLLFGTLYSSKE